MIQQHTLEHGAEIVGGSKVTTFQKFGFANSRPFTKHLPACHGATCQESDRSGSMISSRTVRPGGPAELRDADDNCLVLTFARRDAEIIKCCIKAGSGFR